MFVAQLYINNNFQKTVIFFQDASAVKVFITTTAFLLRNVKKLILSLWCFVEWANKKKQQLPRKKT